MKMLKKIFVQGKEVALVSPKYIMQFSNQFFSLLILAMAVGVMVYAGSKVYFIYEGFFAKDFRNILYDAIFFLVLVKAFQMLLQYYQKRKVSIKQILEVTIAVLVVNVAFAPETRELWMNVVLGVFALGNLIAYLIFYDKLVEIEKK